MQHKCKVYFYIIILYLISLVSRSLFDIRPFISLIQENYNIYAVLYLFINALNKYKFKIQQNLKH